MISWLLLCIASGMAQWDAEDKATIVLEDTVAPRQSLVPSDSAHASTGDSAFVDFKKSGSGSEWNAFPAKESDPARQFSIFNHGKMLEIGLSLNYFHYNEHIEINSLVQDFIDTFGRIPQIKGQPKSTEYGGVFGFTFNSWFYSRNSHLFIRPKFSAIFGIGNAYDGSSQPDTLLDPNTHEVIGMEFKPKVDNKNNYFISTGLDIGMGFPKAGFPLGLYTGIDFKFWYRDMLMYGDINTATSGITYAEMYYWFSVPVGLLITKPVSVTTVLGMDARMDLMFFGQMKNILSSSSSDVTFDFPAVTLGNRVSYKIELFAQKRVSDRVSIKFSPYAMVYGFGKSTTDIATVSIPGYGTESMGSFWEPASGTIWAGFNFSMVFMPGSKPALSENTLPKSNE